MPVCADPAFVPLAMPIMFSMGVLATVLGMTSMKSAEKELLSICAIAFAAISCMLVIFLTLAFAQKIVRRIGEKGIDAAIRLEYLPLRITQVKPFVIANENDVEYLKE